jgi:hypothetical protein
MSHRILRFFCWLLPVLAALALAAAPQGEDPAVDQFFAGIVVESSGGQLIVTRIVQGKEERRAFRMTPNTKVEGRLAARARVTVRWVTGEDGDLATLVIVRPSVPAKGKK